MKKMFWGASFLSLSLILSGCETIRYVDRNVYVFPPAQMLKECPIHGIEGDTVKDAIAQSYKNIESLQICNSQLDAIKQWQKEQQK